MTKANAVRDLENFVVKEWRMRFEGWWANDLPDKGELFMRNGTHYEGEWKDDSFSGIGKIAFISGDVFEGEWHNHLPHRHGKMSYKNGTVYIGEW